MVAESASPHGLAFRVIHWRRPLDAGHALLLLRHAAADQRSTRLVLELRANADGVSWLTGLPSRAVGEFAGSLTRLLPGTVLEALPEPRPPVETAGRLHASTRHRPLRTDNPALAARALLGALTAVSGDDELVLQLVLGPRRIPLAVSTHSPSSLVRPWWDALWTGNGPTLDSEKRTALRTKVGDHGFACTLRLGVRAATPDKRKRLLFGLLAAIRSNESPGVVLRLRRESPTKLNQATAPWRWPLRLNVAEVLTLTGWPLGDDPLPGLGAGHPRLVPAAPAVKPHDRVIGEATAPGQAGRRLGLSAADALHHTWLLGPTGTGKSTLLANLILQDITAGRAVAVVDPKSDLVDDVLARLPDSRRDDVVVLDAADREAPVGLNPLLSRQTPPEVVVDGLLAVLHGLYADSWGPRTADILHASLLTLARRSDASLAMLPLLLTNPGFRRSLTAGLDDPIALGPFWAWYDGLSDPERQQVIAPVMNKLRPILLRPGLRAVLGQTQPRFDVRQVFTERRILLVALAKGAIGVDAAALLGSLVVAQLWQATQERAHVAPARRHPVMIYVDEVQDYLHLPTDLADVLAQARGYGVGLTLAHQHLGQLPTAMRTAVLANARSRVCFQLGHDDAAVLARGSDLELIDFVSLPRYQAYASLLADGQATSYASLRTLPLPEPVNDAAELRATSRARWGRPLDEIEAGFTALVTPKATTTETLGRRPRRQP